MVGRENIPPIESKFRALGTEIYIQVVLDGKKEKKKAKKDIEKAKEIYITKQKIFCRFNPESELTKLNKNLGVFQKASADMVYLAGRALYYNEISGGLYDPRVIEVLEKIGYDQDFRKKEFAKAIAPDKLKRIEGDLKRDLKIKGQKIFLARRMDFTGIAKGYITDCAAEHLVKLGWKNFLVDSGGDMRVIGKNGEGEYWKISMEGVPEDKLMLKLSGKGIATSGISRKKWQVEGKNFHHLVNPQNPSHYSYEVRTVSVIAKNTEEADGRAKTLVLMGKKKGLEFSRRNKLASIFLDYKGNIFISPEAKRYTFFNYVR